MSSASISGLDHSGLILDLICDPGTKGFSAGLVFMKGGYHLLLELFGLSHTRNVFEVVCSLKKKKKSKPEEIMGVKHRKSFCLFRQGVAAALAEVLFSQSATNPLKLELASSEVHSASLW